MGWAAFGSKPRTLRSKRSVTGPCTPSAHRDRASVSGLLASCRERKAPSRSIGWPGCRSDRSIRWSAVPEQSGEALADAARRRRRIIERTTGIGRCRTCNSRWRCRRCGRYRGKRDVGAEFDVVLPCCLSKLTKKEWTSLLRSSRAFASQALRCRIWRHGGTCQPFGEQTGDVDENPKLSDVVSECAGECVRRRSGCNRSGYP